MRSWFLPVLPVMLVVAAFSIASGMNTPSGAAPHSAASDAQFHMLHQQAVDAMEGLRREVDPRVVASQFGK